MTHHIDIKHKVQQIPSKLEFNSLLENSMLSDKEKQLMQMYYVEHKDFGYIADELGYSKAGIIKMHKRILKRIEALI
jgi:DNA-directed RNA polymerase specialized sigma subunit